VVVVEQFGLNDQVPALDLVVGERIFVSRWSMPLRRQSRLQTSLPCQGPAFSGAAGYAAVSSPAFFGPGSYWSYATSWLFNQAS
jgi:hypothetical protein